MTLRALVFCMSPLWLASGASSAAAQNIDPFTAAPPMVVVHAGELTPEVARLGERSARDFGPAVYLRLRQGLKGKTEEFFGALARTYGADGPFEVLIAVGPAVPRLYLVKGFQGPVAVQKLVPPPEGEALMVAWAPPKSTARNSLRSTRVLLPTRGLDPQP